MRMESDEFDFLAPAYVRGFLKSYARWLGVKPDPLVAEFERRYGTGRTDTSQIAALERRTRHRPRQRRRAGSWSVAAVLATFALAALAVVGLLSGPKGPAAPGGRVAGREDRGAPEVTPTATPTPTPSASAEPKRAALALNEGIEVEIVAVRAPCWVSVTADGQEVYTSYPSLTIGQRVGPFRAQDSMDVVLGNPYGVDLVVNGRRFGPMGDAGNPDTINIPEDIKSLL
jgi:cytoskeleton protein RodZ